MFPNIIPTVAKSVSEKVVFANPKFHKTGNNITGRNVNNNPFANDPKAAPLLPPVELPNTPAVAPVKKCGTTPGNIKVHFSIPSMISPTIPPKKLHKNPINTAFGA